MQVPLWATVLIALGSGVLGGALALVGTLVTSRVTRRKDAETHQRERSDATRDLLRHALERSEHPLSREQGLALPGALARMTSPPRTPP